MWILSGIIIRILSAKKIKNKYFDESDHEKFLKWIKENAKSLEEGFYYFENSDESFAREISDALYIFEHS
jgi:CRISPR/Cas system endoribonuclease Cas6 (RAMP superfamily)